MASVVSWSGHLCGTLILSWWGQLVVGAMDTARPQDLKGQTLEGPGVERIWGCSGDPRLPASLNRAPGSCSLSPWLTQRAWALHLGSGRHRLKETLSIPRARPASESRGAGGGKAASS